MPTEVLQIRITATGGAQVQRESAKARGGLTSIDGSAKRASASLMSSAKSILRFTAVSAGVVGVGASVAKVARTTIDFDRSMRNVNSIAQLSEKQFESLRRGVLKLAGPTAQSPITLAQGMYDLVSSGFDAAESLHIVEAAARAATAGLTTTDVSTKAVAAVLNAYKKPASEAGAVSDTLFRTVDRGVISFSELANNIGTVLPFAASAGIGLRDVGASIATLTKQGIGGANAITFLKNAYVSFNKPSADLNKAIKRTGFESGEALIKAKGFQGALNAVIGTTDGSKKAVAALFPNIRALTAVLGLTGAKAQDAGKDLKGMQQDTGATAKALSEQSKSIAFQWNKLKAEASVLAINVGDRLKPALASVLGILSSGITGLPTAIGQVRQFVQELMQVPLVQNALNLVKTAVIGIVGAITLLVRVGGAIANLLSPITSLAGGFLRSDAAVRIFNTALGALVGLMAANIARATAWLGILAVAKVIAFASAIRGIGSAMIALRTAFATNPLGLFLAVVGAAAGALGLFGGKSKEAAVSQQQLADAIINTRTAIDRLNDANLDHAQQTLSVQRAENQLATALQQRRKLSQDGTATAQQQKQAELDVKQARLDLLRETGRLTRMERDSGDVRKKNVADAEGEIGTIRKRRNEIQGERQDIIGRIKALNQQRTRIQKGGGDTGGIDKQVAKERENLADKTRELSAQERQLHAEERRLFNALRGNGRAAQELARRYQDFPKAVKTALRAEDGDAVRKVNSLAKKLEATGRKRTVARILAQSSTAEAAIRRLQAELDQIRSKNIKINVTERLIRSGKLLGPPAPLDNPVNKQNRFSGGKITAPIAIVGEEAPRHPEYVIATNPRYRQRNVGLLHAAASKLGVPGFAKGGVVSAPTVQKLVEREIWRSPMFAQGGVLEQVPVQIDITKDGVRPITKADYPDRAVTKKVAEGGFPETAGGKGGGGKWSGATLSFGHALEKLFNLHISSTWRSPQHNAAVGGVPNSMHTHGSMSNPGAIDFLPPSAAAANYARAAGVPEVLIHDAGSGLHLHLGFFKKGGVIDMSQAVSHYTAIEEAAKMGKVPAFKEGGINTKVGKMVGASVFGGSGDPATGTVGYKGDSLPGTNTYAELQMGHALGSLPYKQKLWIKHKNRVEKGFKRDIGKGGGNVGGYTRAIDLWHELADKVGLSGLGVVRVSSLGPPGKEKDSRPDTKTQRKHQKPKGGKRRPTEIPPTVTEFDRMWQVDYAEKIQVYENLKRQLDASPLAAEEIKSIMGQTGASLDELTGPQLSQPEINRLVTEQESMLGYLKSNIVQAANRARTALVSAIRHLVDLIAETQAQIGHETDVIARRREDLQALKSGDSGEGKIKRKEKELRDLRAKPKKTAADKREIHRRDEEIRTLKEHKETKSKASEREVTSVEREIRNRVERRERLKTRLDKYETSKKEFGTEWTEIYDRQTKYSVGDSIKQALDDTVFNIGELKGTKPPGADATGAGKSVDDELVSLLQQQLQDVRRELSLERAQSPAFAGIFHKGGDIPGTGEKLALVKGGERVQTAAQKNQGPAAPYVHITINGDRAMAAALAQSIDLVTEDVQQKVGQTLAGSLAGPSSPGVLAKYGRNRS